MIRSRFEGETRRLAVLRALYLSYEPEVRSSNLDKIYNGSDSQRAKARGTDLYKLKKLGFVEKVRIGYWRITEKGIKKYKQELSNASKI